MQYKQLTKEEKELISLIGRKWFLTLEELAKRSGLSVYPIRVLLNGHGIGSVAINKLKKFLNNYKGEVI